MKKTIIITIIMAALMLLSSCSGLTFYSDYREIDQLELIQTIGIDESEGQVTVTICTGIPTEGGEPMIIEVTAESVSRALEEAQTHSLKNYTSFDQVKNVVIGEGAAKNIGKYLDFVEREISFRLGIYLFVVEDGTASDLIMEPMDENAGATELLGSLVKSVDLISSSHVFTLGDVAADLEYDGSALASAVRLEENGEILSGGSEVSIKSSGFAVIKDGGLVCFADENEARGINILLNQFESDILEVSDGGGGIASFRLTSAKTDIKPVFESDELKSVEISVKISADVEEIQDIVNIYNEDTLNFFCDEISRAEKSRIEDVLKMSSELKADFLKIGRTINMRQPVRFSKIKDWSETLGSLNYNVNVKTEIARTYDIGNPLDHKGE